MGTHTDSTADKGMRKRLRVQKVLHIENEFLWFQERIRHGELKASKCKGTGSAGDLPTKFWTGRRPWDTCRRGD